MTDAERLIKRISQLEKDDWGLPSLNRQYEIARLRKQLKTIISQRKGE